MLWLSHLKQVAAHFAFVKSTKPILHYPICQACLLNVPSVFPGCWFACGTNQSNTLSISNMDSQVHALRPTIKLSF